MVFTVFCISNLVRSIKFYIEVKGKIHCANCYPGAVQDAQQKVEAIKKSLGLA